MTDNKDSFREELEYILIRSNDDKTPYLLTINEICTDLGNRIDEYIIRFEKFGNIPDFTYSGEYYGVLKGLKIAKELLK